MKGQDFNPTEVTLIERAIERRKSSYQESLEDASGLGARYYRKQLARLDKILETCRSPLPRLSPMDRAHLHGCIAETHVHPMDEVRLAMAGMNDPQWYAFAKANKEEVNHQQQVLGLWNKLKDRKAHPAFLPLTQWEFFESLRSTVRVYCRFSDTKPYKVALWLADGRVFRVELRGGYDFTGYGHFQRMTDKELRSIYSHVLSPSDFCKAMHRHGEERPLNPWQLLLVELLSGASNN